MSAGRWVAVGVVALGCAEQPWTERAVASRQLTLFDANGDGRVDAAEYLAHRYTGPPFGSVDVDHDGDLGPAELVRLARGQDGRRFDGAAVRPTYPAPTAQDAGMTPKQADVLEILGWLNARLVAAGGAPLEPAALQAAVDSGELGSAASLSCLSTLRAGFTSHGQAWPAGLPAAP